MRVRRLVGGGLVSGEGRLRILVVRCYRLDPLAPAGPAAEGREILVVLVREGAGVTRVVACVVAKDLPRIVIHRHGSSLLVITGGHAGALFLSVSQMTRDFDTQRTRTVALSCNVTASQLSRTLVLLW